VKVRDVLQKDPVQSELVNSGVAVVGDVQAESELRTLRYELETFVCEGQYQEGMQRILQTYLRHLDKPVQPAAWISGFFGSGKSHLAKMLRALWVDFEFGDKARARGLAHLPSDVADLLKELSTAGKRAGGLHAAAGTLASGSRESVRLAFLGILFRSVGLPEQYPVARFVLWLRRKRIEEKVRAAVTKRGEDFERELVEMYVSPVLAEALLEVLPNFAASEADVSAALLAQFPQVNDVSDQELGTVITDALTRPDGKFPLTLVVLDEVQQYIGEDRQRSIDVQQLVEFCRDHFESRMLVVGTGQNALSGAPLLQRLEARFPVTMMLSDADVETVIRKIVLAKRADRTKDIGTLLERHAGEISRHLVNSRIAHVTADDRDLVTDYPLLPTRRRFWERVLRAVDGGGTTGTLRTQLRVVHDAVRDVAERPLGWVVPADYLYAELESRLLMNGVLLRDVQELILRQRDGTPDGDLRARLLALVFFIGKLPREEGADLGIRATPEALADLLVDDLNSGSAALRKRVPELLQQLAQSNALIEVESEYRLQTRESAAWNTDFTQRYNALVNDEQRMAHDRADRLKALVSDRLGSIKVQHGRSKAQHRPILHFGRENPKTTDRVPVWVRDGWEEEERTVRADAMAAGAKSPIVFVHLPKRDPEDLRKATAALLASTDVLSTRPNPSTPEGQEAREAMLSRQRDAERRVKAALESVFGGAQVWLAGGDPYSALTPDATVKEAAGAALVRLYPQFDVGDHDRWDAVYDRARKGAGDALEAVGYRGDADKHPVCVAILKELGAGKKGADIRRTFESAPYGWSQEAVDAALLALAVAGHVRTSRNGVAVEPRTLDHAQIGPAEFRPEQVFIGAKQKIELRQLFQAADVGCDKDQEVARAPEFVRRALELAAAAGGEAPAPERPAAVRLKEIQGLSGNDQLLELWKERDDISRQIASWRSDAARIQARLSRWTRLQALVRHAHGLPVADEVQPQVAAIVTERRLLADPDPVPPVADRLTAALRGELQAAVKAYRDRWDTELAALESSGTWQKTDEDVRASLLASQGLRAPETPAVGTEEEVIAALDATSLESWRTRGDALPSRFAQVMEAAAKRLKPSARRVTLPPAGTLETPDDVEAWLGKARERLLNEVASGPVIL
jgi:hypothetical protein